MFYNIYNEINCDYECAHCKYASTCPDKINNNNEKIVENLQNTNYNTKETEK